jgi:hypothetical protein
MSGGLFHCVPGITLLPGDANSNSFDMNVLIYISFVAGRGLAGDVKKDVIWLVVLPLSLGFYIVDMIW